MNQPTLGLLESLRPPRGFRTEAALGMTYSADLVTCMAVLITMDGGDGEQVRYGRIEAFRAMDRLRDRVRICYQAGRIGRRDGSKYPSLTLLDRILVPVQIDGVGSFHPKVWIARQIDDAAKRERFVLVVSSRNVTTSTDWDLGIALTGTSGGSGSRTVALPKVRELAEHALDLAGDSARLATLGILDEVRWDLPADVDRLELDFQVGGTGGLHAAWSTFPARPARVLLLSPFLDGRMIAEAATRFRDVPERRLVAGTNALIEVAVGPQRALLQALKPRQVVPAVEAPEELDADGDPDAEEEREAVRPLHAKVIAIDDGRSATIVLGSNNLTSMGWHGGSTEAFVRLVGRRELCEPLWDWVGKHAQQFDLPDANQAVAEPPLLDRLKHQLHRTAFRLEDHGDLPSRLATDLLLEFPPDVSMEVSRYTTPQDVTRFPSGASGVEIPPCAPALRTRFLVCTLRHHEEQASWIAMVELEPPIEDSRDRELVARLLGLREFLAYLQSMNDEAPASGKIEGKDDEPKASGRRPDPGAALEPVHLEGILRRLVANPRGFAEMHQAIERYGALIAQRDLPPEERVLLDELLAAWTAIHGGFAP